MTASRFIAMVKAIAGEQYIDVEVHPGKLQTERDIQLGKAFDMAERAYKAIIEDQIKEEKEKKKH